MLRQSVSDICNYTGWQPVSTFKLIPGHENLFTNFISKESELLKLMEVF